MNLKRVFIAISFFLCVGMAVAQQAPPNLLHATDFFGNPVLINLKTKDSATVVVFLSANKCIRCVEEFGQELNSLIRPAKRTRIIVLVRVGPAPTMRRQCIDMLDLNPAVKKQVRFLYDLNNSIAGTEQDEEIQGNFGIYGIRYTPAALVSTRKGKVRVYKYDHLFDREARAIVKLGEIVTGLEK